MEELNIYAKIVIGIEIFSVILYPLFIGKKKEGTFNYFGWLLNISIAILVLKAFNLI